MEMMIRLQKAGKSYGGQHVLEGLDLDIPKGAMTAIVGKSGSGKSTLLNILGLLEEADQGELFLLGEQVRKGSRHQRTLFLRKTISYLFQNYALVDHGTVGYNLDLALHYVKGSSREKKRWKEEALARVGLPGIEGKKVCHLSGGEQQRVALARIFLKPSCLILADEPTGSLDSGNARMVLDLLHELHREGRTVLVVTHDPLVAGECQEVLEIERGGIRRLR